MNITGFDVALEMSNNRAYNGLLKSMYHGGKLHCLGFCLVPLRLIGMKLFQRVESSWIYGRKMFETWYKMTQNAFEPVLTYPKFLPM